MNFKTLKNEKLSERVANEVISMIDSGQLKPGDKLPTETSFSQMLGTSRGTLREALALLQYRGYISRKPKDGTYIRSLQNADYVNKSILGRMQEASYKDLLEMREPLEQKIVELAILRGSLQEKQKIADYLESAHRQDVFLDSTFHLKLAELTGNVLLVNFINTYYDLIHELGENSARDQARKLQVYQEHSAIIRAVIDGDIDRAKEAVRIHLRNIGDKITDKGGAEPKGEK